MYAKDIKQILYVVRLNEKSVMWNVYRLFWVSQEHRARGTDCVYYMVLFFFKEAVLPFACCSICWSYKVVSVCLWDSLAP